MRASEMCAISTTQIHCPNVNSSSRHTSRTDKSLNSTFPKMVMPVALLMCTEVLWSCYSVMHKREEDAVRVYKMEEMYSTDRCTYVAT